MNCQNTTLPYAFCVTWLAQKYLSSWYNVAEWFWVACYPICLPMFRYFLRKSFWFSSNQTAMKFVLNWQSWAQLSSTLAQLRACAETSHSGTQLSRPPIWPPFQYSAKKLGSTADTKTDENKEFPKKIQFLGLFQNSENRSTTFEYKYFTYLICLQYVTNCLFNNIKN